MSVHSSFSAVYEHTDRGNWTLVLFSTVTTPRWHTSILIAVTSRTPKGLDGLSGVMCVMNILMAYIKGCVSFFFTFAFFLAIKQNVKKEHTITCTLHKGFMWTITGTIFCTHTMLVCVNSNVPTLMNSEYFVLQWPFVIEFDRLKRARFNKLLSRDHLGIITYIILTNFNEYFEKNIFWTCNNYFSKI